MSEGLYVADQTGAVVGGPWTEPAPAMSFEEFVVARSADLWRSAYLLTGDAHKAEDLLQTALVKVWRRWSSVARDGSVEAYVRRALVTTYTDWWRRKWNAEVPVDVVPERGVAESDLPDVRHDVMAALATLTRGQRAVIVLRYFDDLTEQQTAAALKCSVGTVKSQTARAMQALRSSPLLFNPSRDDAGTRAEGADE
jgi:RNA polymerase sigma-70 factor (sigma-E family)